MDMHELLGTAVADLPDAPDLVPAVRRSHRRRTLAARTGMVAAAAALAVGAGTLTIAAPWHGSAGAGAEVGAAAAAGRVAITATDPVSYYLRFSPGHRSTAPQLSGSTLAGQAYETSYGGHVTVIAVWGSWCAACRAQAPVLAAAARTYAPEGVQFVGIDTLDDATSGRAYESEFDIGYPSLTDPDETLVLSLKPVFPTETLPSMIIVDEDGKVALTAVGVATAAQLSSEIGYVTAGAPS